MIKILQAKLEQYVNHELPDVQAGFRKGRGTRDQIAHTCWIIKKAREFQKNIYFCFIDYAKASRKQTSWSGKESAQGCIPKRLPGRPDEALGGGNQGPSAPAWARQHHSQRDPPFVPRKRLPDWASLELSPSVESCGCGLGPSPVRLG